MLSIGELKVLALVVLKLSCRGQATDKSKYKLTSFMITAVEKIKWTEGRERPKPPFQTSIRKTPP